MQRGDVCWLDPDPARGGEQAGRRPALVVSRDAINRASPVVVVVPFTTYRGQTLYPSDVLVETPEGGLTRDSVAMALHIRAVDKQRLTEPIGQVDEVTIAEVEKAMLQVLDISG